jgi:hypothetical protein
MLRIVIPLEEVFDEETSEFRISQGVVLDLEHSLVSLSKWESKYEIPFLSTVNKTEDQTLDYVRMMILGEIPPEDQFQRLSAANIKEINAYIDAKMTATWFSDKEQVKMGRETVTAEIIYYWMISLGIPFECETWHLNRLITLIRVCNIKNAPKKKMTRQEQMAQQRALNEARRKATGSSG